MDELRDRAWAELSSELGLPEHARAKIEKTGLFQRRVANFALRDFGNAIINALPEPLARIFRL